MHNGSRADRAATTASGRSGVADHVSWSDAATRDVILSHVSELLGLIHEGHDLTLAIDKGLAASITSSRPNDYRLAVQQVFPDTEGSHDVEAYSVLRSDGMIETVYKATARPPFADALKALRVDPAKYDLPLVVLQITEPSARMAANFRTVANAFRDGTNVNTPARAILSSGIDPREPFQVRAGNRIAHQHFADRARRTNVSVLYRDVYAWETRAMESFTRAAQIGDMPGVQYLFDAAFE